MSRQSTYYPSTSSHTTSSLHSSTTASTALATRIAQKRTELQNLQQLRDLSAQLASQMSSLEQKLSTLRDGTEAVACVLANWESVLGVIGLVGAKATTLVPKDENEEHDGEASAEREEEVLPETLVRIPTQHASEAVKDESTVG